MKKIDTKTVLNRINDKLTPYGRHAAFNGKGGVDVVCNILGPVRHNASLADLASELSVLAPGEDVNVVMPQFAQPRS